MYFRFDFGKFYTMILKPRRPKLHIVKIPTQHQRVGPLLSSGDYYQRVNGALTLRNCSIKAPTINAKSVFLSIFYKDPPFFNEVITDWAVYKQSRLEKTLRFFVVLQSMVENTIFVAWPVQKLVTTTIEKFEDIFQTEPLILLALWLYLLTLLVMYC